MAYVRKKDHPCLRCKKHVKSGVAAIMCSVCELWLHVKCPGNDEPEMSQDLYQALDSQQTLTGAAYWTCASCRKFAAKLDARCKALAKSLEAVEKRVGTQDSELEKLKKDVAKLQEDAKTASAKAKPDAVKETVTGAVFKELRERDAKRFNVVVHGLPEAPRAVTDGKARRDADLVKLQDMVNVLELELDASRKVRSATRLGKKGDAARPLLVSFCDPDVQAGVLDSAPKLNRAADAMWKGVRILQDLTRIQRQEDKLMRQECDELAASLSDEEAKNWMYRVVGRRGARRVAKVPLRTVAVRADVARGPRPTNARGSPARAPRATATLSPAARTPPPSARTPSPAAAEPPTASAEPLPTTTEPPAASTLETPRHVATPTTPLALEEAEGPWTTVRRGGRQPQETRGQLATVRAPHTAPHAGVTRRTSARNQARVQQEVGQPTRGSKAPPRGMSR